GGWEHIEAMQLVETAPRMGEEAAALCSAPPCPTGEFTMILGGSQLALQIHESVGHPTEADRIFDHEIDFAGSSFVRPEMVGTHRYGSDQVTLEANSQLAHGLDTRGWDDEGVPSQRWPIVDKGILKGLLTDREWASGAGDERSRGSSRAEGWYNPPIVRITNLSLLPGGWDLEALLADTEDGALLVDGIRTWSIDQRRLNFQFTCQAAWEVQDGKPGRLYRQPTYQGSTPAFWAGCDAVCSPEHFQVFGVPNCGKGNPYQIAEMSHGAAPARFRGVSFIH
ncbi:MAG TPA: TldD/PmbA family protein, partial [Planctomycetota bacterium]|nr:TldD/PmbA family protein [Planctomycetota bacterium]